MTLLIIGVAVIAWLASVLLLAWALTKYHNELSGGMPILHRYRW